MIQSMTGYGEAQSTRDGLDYVLELRSVNNRYFKPVIKLPESMQSLETEVEKLLRGRLGRGSITYQLRVKNTDSAAAGEINVGVLRAYAAQLQTLVREGLLDRIDVGALVDLPGVYNPREIDDETRRRMWTAVQQLTQEAIGRLIAMRGEEGAALARDLLNHAAEIRRLAELTGQRAPQVVVGYQNRLRLRVHELLADTQLKVDQDDLLREVAIYAERCDISEEITRLKSHLDQFEQLVGSDEQAGRKLDFLAQEMLREVNTIGSKANDATIARYVVEMKGLIDRLKEQVQNVE